MRGNLDFCSSEDFVSGSYGMKADWSRNHANKCSTKLPKQRWSRSWNLSFNFAIKMDLCIALTRGKCARKLRRILTKTSTKSLCEQERHTTRVVRGISKSTAPPIGFSIFVRAANRSSTNLSSRKTGRRESHASDKFGVFFENGSYSLASDIPDLNKV